MGSTIGIKLANGDFYPILEEQEGRTKRLILTTAHDNQETVYIELYKSAATTLRDAAFMGRIVVTPIKPALQGEPSIQVEVTIRPSGSISAYALDLDTSAVHERHSLRVSEAPENPVELADLKREPSVGVPPLGLYETPPERKRVPWLLVGLIVLLPLVGALFFFLFSGSRPFQHPEAGAPLSADTVSHEVSKEAALEKPSEASLQDTPEDPREKIEVAAALDGSPEVSIEQAPIPTIIEENTSPAPLGGVPEELEKKITEAPVIEAPATAPLPPAVVPSRKRPPAPVASYKVPTKIPRGGVSYRIRWGDTLWDIAAAFYRNPWLYTRIARFNNIRRPDLIVAGRTIRIPPRN
ncbi:MAG: LysM peptidoglycan-binding domain-containing protein [Spirochaetaceae bacterium]|jgi:hypothetical protein|nr:LysM peptidoglycan-binding domain-containing protein [Spirochaetaceae bacterium]